MKIPTKGFFRITILGLLLFGAPAWGASQAQQDGHDRQISFTSLGQDQALVLRGVQSSAKISFGGRLDQVVRKASLNLHYGISPALMRNRSHLNIRLNQRLVATLQFPEEGDTANLRATVALPAHLFADYNDLSFELIGHYTDSCEFVGHSSLWLNIASDSHLNLHTSTLPLAPRLELLPAPFFDSRDNRDLSIALVLADRSEETLHAAGMLASWLGSYARYRGMSFDLLERIPHDRHSIVIGDHSESLELLEHQPPADPSVSIFAHPDPEHAAQRILLLHGGSEGATRQAALALIYGLPLLSGQHSEVRQPITAPARVAYDAPAWLPTDRPVRLGELSSDPLALEARGNAPAPRELQFRLPPDLFPGFGNSAELLLNYRYTPPTQRDNSRLSVHVNERFAQAWQLLADEDAPGAKRFYLPLFERDFFAATSQARIPAFQIGSSNTLSFAFNLDHHFGDPCKDMPSGTVYSSIDEDSTIDFSHFPHYLELPDLGAFASSGFPFTRYADLGDTAILLPAQAQAEEIRTYLYLMARFGRLTGAAASRFQLGSLDTPPDQAAHWLIIGPDPRQAPSSAIHFKAQSRILQRAEQQATQVPALLELHSDGPLAALSGFASPQHAGYSVVALSARRPQDLALISRTLEDAGHRAKIDGSISLIRPNQVTSLDFGQDHAIGKLSWLQRIWLKLARSPSTLAAAGVAAGLILAMLLFWLLRAIARRRLQT